MSIGAPVRSLHTPTTSQYAPVREIFWRSNVMTKFNVGLMHGLARAASLHLLDKGIASSGFGGVQALDQGP